MKAIVAFGGLGNVMFLYALVCAYREKGIKSFLFMSDTNLAHHSSEFEKIFPNASQWRGLNFMERMCVMICKQLRKIHYKKYRIPHKFLFFPFGVSRYDHFSPMTFFPQVFDNLNKNEYLIGMFQSYKYFEDCKDAIYKDFQFSETLLSDATQKMAYRMGGGNSVSLHVRRGDYMNSNYYHILGKVCDIDYYQRAIEEIKKRVSNPKFFVFSDDKEYVAKNLLIEDAVYVDFNYGKDSWQDMYLMTQCHHHIIANSTFSWWGAWLGQHKDKIVVAPSRWFASLKYDEIIPSEWIRV